jgi:isoleucyl-tRNA synthetase
LVKKIRPNFKLLGPKFGGNMRHVAAEIQKFTQEDITRLEKEGEIKLTIDDNLVILTADEVEISSQDIEGWLVANQNNLTVALDVKITEELKNEGVARELVNRIQNLRKESGFDVTDKIDIYFQKDGLIELALINNETYIKIETLANNLFCLDAVNEGLDIVFDNINTKLVIQKA